MTTTTDTTYLRECLTSVFADEWQGLSADDQHAILADCEDVEDLGEYRRSIGANNLQSYASTLRAQRTRLVRTALTGTLDELEPELRARGYTAVRTMGGPLDLSVFDPYGMRRLGSVNIQSARWAHHIYRGTLAFMGGKAYLVDATIAEPPFVNGAFELL